jgi:hypothetical protein
LIVFAWFSIGSVKFPSGVKRLRDVFGTVSTVTSPENMSKEMLEFIKDKFSLELGESDIVPVLERDILTLA